MIIFSTYHEYIFVPLWWIWVTVIQRNLQVYFAFRLDSSLILGNHHIREGERTIPTRKFVYWNVFYSTKAFSNTLNVRLLYYIRDICFRKSYVTINKIKLSSCTTLESIKCSKNYFLTKLLVQKYIFYKQSRTCRKSHCKQIDRRWPSQSNWKGKNLKLGVLSH